MFNLDSINATASFQNQQQQQPVNNHIPGIEEVVEFSGAQGLYNNKKYFKTQADLFDFIKTENQKIIEKHLRLGQSLRKSNFLQAGAINNNNNRNNSSSNNMMMMIGSSSNNNNGGGIGNSMMMGSSSQNHVSMMMNNRRSGPASMSSSYNQNQYQTTTGKLSDEDLKPIEEKLLRPFCVHVDPRVAPSAKNSSNHQQQFHHQQVQQQNQNRFFSISGSGNRREQGLLAMFGEAGKTEKEKFSATSTTLPSRRERESNNTNNNNGEDQDQNQQQQMVQTRFFVALTREKFARVARGDLIPQLPQEHQHFFEIIEEHSPCVLYFDVEMEPHTALTQEERKSLIEQVDAVEKNTNHANNTSKSLKTHLPVSLRRKLHCCPVGCDIEFDETKTRNVLIAELKRFLSPEVFPLPLPSGGYAGIDEHSFIVLVSPSKGKFSQHYIIRFKEPDVRFANNSIDQKLVVSCFVDYLYDRAFEDPLVHSALFYHESVERRNCVVSLNSSSLLHQNDDAALPDNRRKYSSSSSLINEEYSFANSPAQIRAQQQRQEKEKLLKLEQQQQQQESSSAFEVTTTAENIPQQPVSSSSYSLPAISLKCIIDEAVYTKNRMMRCYGSSKVGKCAILDFDRHWHQGGRLSHYEMGNNKEGILASTLISEPVITTTDEKLKAASLFRIIDSSSLLASALARGNKAVQGLQIATMMPSQHNTNNGRFSGAGIITSSSNIFNASDYETTNYNGPASLMKFPVLCKEIIAAQISLERSGGNNNNNMMMLLSQQRKSVAGGAAPTGNVSVESIQLSIPKKNSAGDDLENRNFHHLRLTIKVRGTRFCHVVKRQHRSNGIYWIVKCSLPTKNFVTSNSTTNAVVNSNGYGAMEQRCFDDDCKGKQTLKIDLSEGALCEVRMVSGLGSDSVGASSANLSNKMVVLNQGNVAGGYISAAARQLLEQNEEYQKKKKEEEEAENLRVQQVTASKPKMTKWIPPHKRNGGGGPAATS